MEQKGRIKKIENVNGNLVFKNEKIFAPPNDGEIENAILAGEIEKTEADEFNRQRMIYAIHEELHDIHKQVKAKKKRADELKEMLTMLGVDSSNILTKPIPRKPVPPKKNKKNKK